MTSSPSFGPSSTSLKARHFREEPITVDLDGLWADDSDLETISEIPEVQVKDSPAVDLSDAAIPSPPISTPKGTFLFSVSPAPVGGRRFSMPKPGKSMAIILLASAVAAAALLALPSARSSTPNAKLASALSKPVTNQSATLASDAAEANYKTYLSGQSTQIVTQAEALDAAIKAGNVEQAQAAYLATREPYERMWPLADVAGMNGRFEASQLQGGFDWAGFHRIEKGLFLDRSTNGLAPISADLLINAKSLQAAVSSADLGAVEIAEGSAEMLNEASHHNIFGDEERYARSDLADMQATVDGSKVAFDVLRPALGNDAIVGTLDQRFAAMNDVLAQYKSNGAFVNFDTLNADDTKSLSHALDSLAEPLAYLPAKAGAIK